jgi:hypothetical protein
VDAIKQIAEAISAIDKLKRQLESTRAHAQDPQSRDYVYVKISEAVKQLGDISAQLREALTGIN